jgi:two-component system phosphate regulon sensor histidine kinase PhoR
VDTLRGGAIKDPPAAKRFLKRMDSEVDTLTQMVQELLELSRVESGQAPLRLEPTPASEVILPPADRLRPQAERAGLEFTVHLPSQLPLVLADADRIQMVVTNLVHNAVKFTPPGGRVLVSAGQNADEVVFSVQDTGVGIPAEDLARIFERFYKADRARSGGGTGLGLAIAKHIVQGHGGRIWVESVEGEGSAFSFTLPSVK